MSVIRGRIFEHNFGIKWKVGNFQSIPNESSVESPIFLEHSNQTKWHLSLSKKNAQVYLYLHFDSPGLVNTTFSFGLIEIANGCKCFNQLQNHVFSDASRSIGRCITSCSAIVNDRRYSPYNNGNYNITVFCEITCKPNSVDISKYSSNKFHLSQALRAKGHYDLTLVAEDVEIPAHFLVLATVSPVFAAMYEHKTKEKLENRVVIDDIKAEILQLLVDFAYEANLDLDAKSLDQIEDLLVAADKYQIKLLRDECTRHLASKLTPSTVTRILAFADCLQLDQLYSDGIQVLKGELLTVVTSSEWIEQQDNFLKKILQTLGSKETAAKEPNKE